VAEESTRSEETGAARAAGAAAGKRGGLRNGPGRLLVTLYGVFTVGAASRSAYQLSTRFDEAPLAYLLSAVAALIYAFITVALVRGGERARRLALVCCAVELAGVLTIGTWTLADPGAFPDATVWSDYGIGYLFLPLVLPVTGLLWLRRARQAPRAPGGAG
jgi:drug/metabolite transporter (DMT)-like permease